MELWKELTARAVLGTARGTGPLPLAEGPLGEALPALAGGEPEPALLAAAAAASVYQRAGTVAEPATVAALEPAAVERLPRVSSAAALSLRALLNGERKGLLPEWLRLAAQAGRRAPEEALPDLLEWGRGDRALREAIRAVVGERGLWLAAQNPEWSYLAGEDDRETWETGTREARVAALERLRRQDPAGARELLAASWSQESAEDRPRLLAVLLTGLEPGDEPFLDAALEDRRKEVRTLAADYLSRLPGSALSRRMVARVTPLVTVQRRLLGRALEVRPPEACDAAMVRDGVDAKVPAAFRSTIGEKAWWLEQIVGATPPAHWKTLDSNPGALLDLAAKTEWHDALKDGWAQAAIRHRDVEWAETLLQRKAVPPDQVRELLQVLPPPRAEAVVLRSLQGKPDPFSTEPGLADVVGACRHDWSPELGRAVLAALRGRMAAKVNYSVDWEVRNLMREAALRFPPFLLSDAAQGWPEAAKDWSNWESAVREFLSTLEFRQQMRRELS